jgi:putative nucleotidyltransferase with HDIG domain
MKVERENLICYVRMVVIFLVVATLFLLNYFTTQKNGILMSACGAALIYGIISLFISGKVDKSILYYFNLFIDLFLVTILALGTGMTSSPFIPLYLLVIITFGTGRSLIKNLSNTIFVSIAYGTLIVLSGDKHPPLWQNIFTFGSFIIFGFLGLLTARTVIASGSNDEASQPEVEPSQQSPDPAARADGKNLAFQIPKTLDEANLLLRAKSEEIDRIREDFQNERQMNNTIRYISLSIATQKDLIRLYEDIVTRTRGEINAQAGFLLRLDNNRLKVKFYDGGISEITLKVFETSLVFTEVVNTGKTLRFGTDHKERLESAFGGTHEKIKSLLCVPLKTQYDNKPFGLIGMANNLMSNDFSLMHEMFLSLIAIEAAVAIRNIEYLEDIERKYEELILGLARAIEAKDNYTQQHVDRVREYAARLATMLAPRLGMSDEDIKIIKTAATLHDVGKIATPEHILNKQGPLDAEEFKIMKEHTRASVSILRGISSLDKEVLPLVLYHHERYDGKGYPEGRKGDEIPIGARIIAVADTFDAMTSDRPYRKGFPRDEALKKMEEECMGTQFDADILKAFVSMMKRQLAVESGALDESLNSYPRNPELSGVRGARPKRLDIK